VHMSVQELFKAVGLFKRLFLFSSLIYLILLVQVSDWCCRLRSS
jgi:hypothetical protein